MKMSNLKLFMEDDFEKRLCDESTKSAALLGGADNLFLS